MEGSFVDALVANTSKPIVLEVGGRDVLLVPNSSGGFSADPRPIPAELPDALRLSTLTGFVDYITHNRDGIDLASAVVRVANEGLVALCGPLIEPFQQRACYAIASCADVLGEGFCFGQWYAQEDFVVALQALFLADTARNSVLGVVSSLSDGQVRTADDDGVTQTVTAKQGVVRKANVDVPNPVTLCPYRTFREVEQPASPFVLRLRSGSETPAIALFEADGGGWKLEAIERVRKFLAEKLGDKVAIIA